MYPHPREFVHNFKKKMLMPGGYPGEGGGGGWALLELSDALPTTVVQLKNNNSFNNTIRVVFN